MVWTISLLVFIAQLICCVWAKGKYMKYLPTLIAVGLMSVVVLQGTLDVINVVALVALTRIILMGGLAIGLYHLVLWAKKGTPKKSGKRLK